MYGNHITAKNSLIVGLGILNVWLIRGQRPTNYRGGNAQSLKAEFAAYGLPAPLFYVIGTLKLGAALALLLGIALPQLVAPAAALMTALMLGAIVMHVKVRDPAHKSLPAAILLLLSVAIRWL